MTDIVKRLQSSLAWKAIYGNSEEKGIFEKQVREAVREIVLLRAEKERLENVLADKMGESE